MVFKKKAPRRIQNSEAAVLALENGRYQRLEPCEGKLSRTVLRGGMRGNPHPLLGGVFTFAHHLVELVGFLSGNRRDIKVLLKNPIEIVHTRLVEVTKGDQFGLLAEIFEQSVGKHLGAATKSKPGRIVWEWT